MCPRHQLPHECILFAIYCDTEISPTHNDFKKKYWQSCDFRKPFETKSLATFRLSQARTFSHATKNYSRSRFGRVFQFCSNLSWLEKIIPSRCFFEDMENVQCIAPYGSWIQKLRRNNNRFNESANASGHGMSGKARFEPTHYNLREILCSWAS